MQNRLAQGPAPGLLQGGKGSLVQWVALADGGVGAPTSALCPPLSVAPLLPSPVNQVLGKTTRAVFPASRPASDAAHVPLSKPGGERGSRCPAGLSQSPVSGQSVAQPAAVSVPDPLSEGSRQQECPTGGRSWGNNCGQVC